MESEIKVSIICNAYNHSPYIREALEGFVQQKTNFTYEISIHDDASTDDTAEIIHEFEVKYPDLIKPIYHKENQYSKGIDITGKYHLPQIKGKYVALCEGDDYWTDPSKLQKQYDAMEKHPEVDICAHAATKIRAIDGKNIGKISPREKEEVITLKDVIDGGGGFVATNSLFFRRELLETVPKFREIYRIDYSLQIQGALRGGMLYLPDDMSVYRVSVPGSWTVCMKDSAYASQERKQMRAMLRELDMETEGKYTDVIQLRIANSKMKDLIDAGKYSEIRKGEIRKAYDEMSTWWKVKMYIKECFPWMYAAYRKRK